MKDYLLKCTPGYLHYIQGNDSLYYFVNISAMFLGLSALILLYFNKLEFSSLALTLLIIIHLTFCLRMFLWRKKSMDTNYLEIRKNHFQTAIDSILQNNLKSSYELLLKMTKKYPWDIEFKILGLYLALQLNDKKYKSVFEKALSRNDLGASGANLVSSLLINDPYK